MRTSIFVTIFVVVVSRTKVISAEGYLGCRFSSSVCEEDELCEEDDLFGQCTKNGIGHTYYYNIDRAGYQLLRQTLSALLTENYSWTDVYTQAILASLLKPYLRISSQSQADLPSVEESEGETSVLPDGQQEQLETLYQQFENLQDGQELQENYVPDVDSGEAEEFQDSDEESWETLLWNYLDSVLKSENVDKGTRDRFLTRYFMEYYHQLSDEEDKLADDGGDELKEAVDDSEETGRDQQVEDWDTIQKLQLMRDYLAHLYDREMARQGKEALLDDFGYRGDGEGDDDLDKKTANLDGEITVHKYDPGRVEAEGYEVVLENEGDRDFGDIVGDDEVPSSSVGTESDFEGSDIEITSEDIDDFIDSLENPGENLSYLSKDDIEDLRRLIKEILAEIQEEVADEELTGLGEEPIFEDDDKTMAEEIKQMADAPQAPPEKKSVGISSQAPPDEQTPALVTEATNEDDVITEGELDVIEEPTAMEPEDSETLSEEESNLVQDLLIDTDYAFVTTAERLTPELGQRLVEELANIIGLPVSTFSNIKVSEYQVSFKVNPNLKNMTASDIDGEAAKHKDDIKDTMGLSITSTGVGDQSHVQVVEHLPSHTPSYVVLTFILTGCVAGILIAVLIIYVLRKQSKQKAKLQNLTSAPPTDQPTTADYQDLCRQRMASKSSEKPEPLHRIGSLGSHYSDAPVPSPSSRSSTSSWSEEPVHPNMDISTGHVVLSYMEDHLKNKDRLAKEWESLCQYEAEPNSTNAGSDPNNSKKNRYPETLPYDHSRVVLNDSTNADSSDYINANTITDHDPRAPAYIATQGPLPNTVADFWQMVWEQGCMVIVNLTQNMDDKDRVMCHPYWPEEGSQLYHIYEVHLVSEHIWCDDYLVRSFYLKNLQTNETRTVTQFHYLTWPDMGEPSSPKVLLEFRRKVNKSFRGRACPIVVHCSDGCGRTGTYCLVDMVLNRMTKGAKEIDIAATLEHIRDQRLQMVKTRNQFDFALKSVAEEVNAILKALPQ